MPVAARPAALSAAKRGEHTVEQLPCTAHPVCVVGGGAAACPACHLPNLAGRRA
jgi:hypothetical protein